MQTRIVDMADRHLDERKGHGHDGKGAVYGAGGDMTGRVLIMTHVLRWTTYDPGYVLMRDHPRFIGQYGAQ